MRHRRWSPPRAGQGSPSSLRVVEASPTALLPNRSPWERGMYAIAFDLDTNTDTDTLQRSYHNASWQSAYEDIRRVLATHGFARQQGSVYFGDQSVDAVRCVLAVQELTRTYSWFAGAVNDIRMLRIEDDNDLRPAVDEIIQATARAAAPASEAG